MSEQKDKIKEAFTKIFGKAYGACGYCCGYDDNMKKCKYFICDQSERDRAIKMMNK